MKRNMGGFDKSFRLVAGIIILLVGFIYESWWGLIGIIPIVTSFVGFCPFYVPLKISTLKSKKSE